MLMTPKKTLIVAPMQHNNFVPQLYTKETACALHYYIIFYNHYTFFYFLSLEQLNIIPFLQNTT